MQLQDDYFAAYRSLRLTRDADGSLVVEFHGNGGPFRFTAQDHTEFVDAFYRIAQDRENKIVILTGAGKQGGTRTAVLGAHGTPEPVRCLLHLQKHGAGVVFQVSSTQVCDR